VGIELASDEAISKQCSWVIVWTGIHWSR